MKIQRLLLSILLLLASPTLAEPARPMTEILPQFEKLSQDLFQESGVPGMAIAIVYKGDVIYLKGFGVRKAGESQAVDADTVFQLASCSKPMSSTALAVLVGQGKIGWDDPIARSYPEFHLEDSWVTSHLTYRDLLSHHSGLPEFAGDILEDLGYDRMEILHRLRLLPGAYDFRVGYAYTNFGFTAGAQAAALAIGSSYEDMMEQTLFAPLAMTSTSARFEDYRDAPNRAFTHSLRGGKAIPTVRMPQAQAPAGGVSSTARDLARWMELHLERGKIDGEQLVPEEALAQTYRIHSLASNNPANFSASGYYGLGWGVAYDDKGRLRLSHSGAFDLGVRTSVTMLPQERLGIVVLSNAFPAALPEALSVSFLQMYDGKPADLASARKVNEQVIGVLDTMLGGSELPKPPARPAPSRALRAYEGRYDNDYYGPAVVSNGAGGLSLGLGTRKFSLRHLDGDVFAAEVAPETYEDLAPFQVQFSCDGSGQVTGFRQQGLGKPFPWFARSKP